MNWRFRILRVAPYAMLIGTIALWLIGFASAEYYHPHFVPRYE